MSNAQHTRNAVRIWPAIIVAAFLIAVIAALPLFAREFTQEGEGHAIRAAVRTNSAGEQVTPRERYENFKLWQADQVDQARRTEEDALALSWP
jgi:hypothetical protein